MFNGRSLRTKDYELRKRKNKNRKQLCTYGLKKKKRFSSPPRDMSDNEYERFEVTDYDLANEFNPNRPRRRQTKHQQIYGIWADDSENDSGDEPSGSKGKRRSRKQGLAAKSKDYTAPVSFVAGGIQQSGKKSKKPDDEKITDDEENPITDEEDENDARPSFGHKQPQLLDNVSQSSDDSSEEERTASKVKSPPSVQRPGFGHKSHVPSGKNVGAWEMHTRGIGAKLLLQMGYQPGKGLGKDLQGISQPVEAHVRKGRGAIGAYGPEAPATIGGKGPKALEGEDVRETKELTDQQNKWKKGGEVRQDKPKRYYYKTVEEVIEKGKKSNFLLSEKLSKKLGNVPVIDMTGPEKRVLSGYHALGQSKIVDEDLYDVEKSGAQKTAASSVGFVLPELMHNLQLIVNMCEQDIIVLDKTEREASDKQDALVYEHKHLEEIISLERNHMNTLESALGLVEELSNGGETLTLERAECIFLELQHDFAAEYEEFALGDLAAGVIAPLVKSALANWKPLEEPTRHVDMVKKWRTILDVSSEPKSESRSVFDPYSSLVWAGVIPSFRACATAWNPKQHEMMAALLDCWSPMFPTWILDSVLEQLILPRLVSGVRDWDPLTDTVPIHIWILPWNTILGHKMEEYIFPTIREKLGAALRAWMPRDRSARAMLTPWKNAFEANAMQMFLLQHIVPKLQLVLNEFIINPMQQDMEPWNQVWEWRDILPPMLMGQLLDKHFFPKWMQVLVLWLNQTPDYLEISRWYSGWKVMLTDEIMREPNIKGHFRRAIEIMRRATEPGGATPLAAGTPVPPIVPTTPLPPQPPSLLDLHIAMMPAQLEFKELVSQKCAERGIIFAPLPGRREQGKQVYRVGKMYCFIDRNVCMISDNTFKNWTPVSIVQLLERAVTGSI